MKKIRIYFLVLFACCVAACSGNDEIENIEFWPNEYELPQGKSDADERIVDFYEQFGTYILYEYTYMDYRYEFLSSYNYELPDPVHVGDMLDLLEEIWFDFYPPEFLTEHMPLKIMLADHFEYVDQYSGYTTLYFSVRGTSCIGVGFCSDTLSKISPETKAEFKNDLQSNIWENYLTQLEFPEEFYEVSDYSSPADGFDPTSDNYARKRGFVALLSSGYADEWSMWPNNDGELDKSMDLRSFIMGMVGRTSADWAMDLEYPLVKQKYDILQKWIQEKYGFDIQEIADKIYE